MKKLLFGLAALPLLAGAAFAAQPIAAQPMSQPMSLSDKSLSDQQMDTVTAGFDFIELDITNTSATIVAVDKPFLGTCATCYLQVTGSWFRGGTTTPTPQPVASVQSMQVVSQFGP
jgi:hypothetical protein